MGKPQPEHGCDPTLEEECPETVDEGCGDRGLSRAFSSEDPSLGGVPSRDPDGFNHAGLGGVWSTGCVSCPVAERTERGGNASGGC